MSWSLIVLMSSINHPPSPCSACSRHKIAECVGHERLGCRMGGCAWGGGGCAWGGGGSSPSAARLCLAQLLCPDRADCTGGSQGNRRQPQHLGHTQGLQATADGPFLSCHSKMAGGMSCFTVALLIASCVCCCGDPLSPPPSPHGAVVTLIPMVLW